MIKNQDIKFFADNARAMAIMMSDDQIEKVIVEFVEVKLIKDHARQKKR